MEPINETGWIHRIDRPTFAVREGLIEDRNSSAAGRLVPIGEPVEPMLVTGLSEYRRLGKGWLALTIQISGVSYRATVQRMGQWDIFALEPEEVPPELRALSLAAQKLRIPLGGLFATVEHMSDGGGDPELREDLALVRRNLHQLLRMVQNMDDGLRYLTEPPRLELRDVGALMAEVFERAAAKLEELGIQVAFQGLSAPAYSLIDADRLDKTILQILSNSASHGAPGGTINAKLTRRGTTLYLTVQDTGRGLDKRFAGNIFSQYLREPGYEPGRPGIGMGLSNISAFAFSHGGTVVLEPRQKGLRLTLSLPMRQDDLVRASTLRTDLTGGRDMGLVELSELLPHWFYDPKKEN